MIARLPLQRALDALEGLSVGDAFGQCFFQELQPEELIAQQTLPQEPWYYTDDTEMSLSVVWSLQKFGAIDQDLLATSLAHRYDFQRAYGPSMHRVLDRIRSGEHWRDVATSSFEGQGSYGNGAAMRAAPLGAYFADDVGRAAEQAAMSAAVTHAHPEGIAGAVAVAVAAAVACRLRGELPSHAAFLAEVIKWLPESEVRSKVQRAQSLASGSQQFAVSLLGNGTSMSAQDTVPYALWCCAKSLDDYPQALWLAVGAGGDRDTLCAIVGGIVAAHAGREAIPPSWLTRREALPDWHLHRAG
jgi:ADP-ribosylglycohydrolase